MWRSIVPLDAGTPALYRDWTRFTRYRLWSPVTVPSQRSIRGTHRHEATKIMIVWLASSATSTAVIDAAGKRQMMTQPAITSIAELPVVWMLVADSAHRPATSTHRLTAPTTRKPLWLRSRASGSHRWPRQ